MIALTDPQLLALRFLADRTCASPAELGAAIGGTRAMKAQGLGRLGGTMGTRLVRLKLAEHASWDRGGFPGYRINAAGRAAIARAEGREP